MENLFTNTPMTIAGVGGGLPTRWIYSEYGKLLNVYGIRNGVSITFNLASVDDINAKLDNLISMKSKGIIDADDLNELEERLRTSCDFVVGGSGSQTRAGIDEGKSFLGYEGKLCKPEPGDKLCSKDGILAEFIRVVRPVAGNYANICVKYLTGPDKGETETEYSGYWYIEESCDHLHTEEVKNKIRKTIEAKKVDKELGILDESKKRKKKNK